MLSTDYTISRDRADPNASGNHRKNLMLSLETSLRRLRTDYIDLYWVHIWDPNTLQVPYSLLMRDIERELLPMAQAHGMTVAAWSPLAGGVLSGKFSRPGGPEAGTRIAPETLGDREHAVAGAVQKVADDLGVSPAQVAIAETMVGSPAALESLGQPVLRTEERGLRRGGVIVGIPAGSTVRRG